MNQTEKATMDAAKRMLRGKIEIEEVSMLLGIPVEKLVPIKEEIDEEMRKVFGNSIVRDTNGDEVLFDLFDDEGTDEDIPDAT